MRDYIATTEHKTIIGKIRFNGSENVGTPGTVSQWQKRRVRGGVAARRSPPRTLIAPSRPGSNRVQQAGAAATARGIASLHGAWLELIASGLITGGIYALVALGLNLQYGLMRILNIAHGEFLMLGAYPHLDGADRRSASRRC